MAKSGDAVRYRAESVRVAGYIRFVARIVAISGHYITAGYLSAMSVSPSYSLLRILAHVDQKISDAKLTSDVPGDDAERAIAITILSDLRDALEEVGQELSANRAKRRTN